MVCVPLAGVSLAEVTLATSGTGFVLVASPRSEPSFFKQFLICNVSVLEAGLQLQFNTLASKTRQQ